MIKISRVSLPRVKIRFVCSENRKREQQRKKRKRKRKKERGGEKSEWVWRVVGRLKSQLAWQARREEGWREERTGRASPEDVCPQKPWSSALSDGRSVDLVTGAIHHSRWLASHAARGETRVTTLPSLLATFDWLRLRLRW